MRGNIPLFIAVPFASIVHTPDLVYSDPLSPNAIQKG